MTTAPARPALGIVPYIVAGCMFMENLDATVIVTALPTMARAMGTDATTLSLGISAYMVAIAIFLPLSAWLSDRIGTRTVIVGSILLFVATSVLCGLAQDLPTFVAMRVAQGAAAALMTPSGRLVVLRDTPKAHLVHAIAILTWPALIAPILGPPLGGFLTTYASWRWIFFLNVPVGLIGAVLALRYIPQQRSETRRPFDFIGFLLAGAAMACLILGLELVGASSEQAVIGGQLLGSGLVLALLTLRHLRRAAHPLVDLAPAKVRSFAIATFTGGTLTRIAVGATPFLLPLMFQSVFGYSAFLAGAMTLVYFSGNLGMKLFTTRILRRFGFRAVLIVNGAALAATIGACAFASLRPALPLILVILLAGGATRSLQFTALNTMTFADIPPEQAGAANTLNSLTHQIGFTLGVALAAFTLHASMAAHDGAMLATGDFQIAFIAFALLSATALLSFARLTAATGREVSGHN